VVVVGALLLAACSGGHDDAISTTTTALATTTSTTAAPTTTTTVAPTPPADPGAKAVLTSTGVILPVRGVAGPTTYRATSPCGDEVIVAGAVVDPADVVLDPGHGGDESGALGPGGTREKDVNLAVAQAAQRALEDHGLRTVLTRTGDYRTTLASRAAVAKALSPKVFLSIHHNAEPDGPRPAGPGSETYRQIASPESKRLSGLVYEEVVKAFSAFKIAWVADTDAGAKYRAAGDGGDYYGVLRRTAGIPAVLSEAAFITNPPEEALLRTPAFQAVEGQALARAVERFLETSDPGSGFVEPYPRTAPAGPGGGADGCVDPPLD
jgi:N-acetylmuramoyl-L-alanine amidase